MTLPDAVVRALACGACGGELDAEDDGPGLICYDCRLRFDQARFDNDEWTASFLDPDEKTCGLECDNYWHGDDKIRPGMRFDCKPCQLPAGHSPAVHWRGCVQLSDSPEG